MKGKLLIPALLLLLGAGCAAPAAVPEAAVSPTPAPAVAPEPSFKTPEAPQGWTRFSSPLGVTFIYPEKAANLDAIAVATEGTTIKLFASEKPSFTHSIEVVRLADGQSPEAYLQASMYASARAAGCAYRTESAGMSPSGRRIDAHLMVEPTGIDGPSPCPGAGSYGRILSSPDVPGVVVVVSIGQDTFMNDAETFLRSVEPIR